MAQLPAPNSLVPKLVRRSLRWRLQGWYAVVLQAVVAGFAALLFFSARSARFQEIDNGLTASAHYLDVSLRRLPSLDPDGFDRPPPPPRRGGPPGGKKGPPSPGRGRVGRGPPPEDRPEPVRDGLLDEVTLPGRAGAADDDNTSGTYFVIWRGDGTTLKSYRAPEGDAAPVFALATPAEPSVTPRGDYREARLRGPSGTHILVGRSVRKELADLRTLAWQLAGAGAVVLLVGLAGGWLVTARILKPIGAIAATASAISAANLSERIDPATVDRELAELADVLNATFDRLEASFERQARFTADASHELRTPLAIIRSHAQLALGRPRTSDEYRKAAEACLHAADRMTALVEGLLTLARADAGKLDLRRQPVDLRKLTEATLALFQPLAEDQGVSLAACLKPVRVIGDPDRLAQVLTNLLSNAVRYNKHGGSVRVWLGPRDNAASLSVADTGRGIPEADRGHIFDRFYRVDAARSRASGGTGLGLAICKSIVEAHGGLIAFTSELDRGTTFEVRLPLNSSEGDSF